MKKKRIKDRSLLDEIKKLPCLCCGSPFTDPAHLISRGAGGDDTRDNVMPLCRKHHQEQHQKGIVFLAEKYKGVLQWLYINERIDVYERAKSKKV